MSTRSTLTHCPAHSDGTPSLSIREGHTAPLPTCQTGCSREQVIAALKQKHLWPVQERPAATRRREPVRTYRYVADDGRLVVEKGRFEYTDRETGERRKFFNWRLPGAENWGNLGDQLKVEDIPLFNLPDVLRRPDEPVFFVEGEKACEALTIRGVLSVCLAGGASQRTFGDSLTYLMGREVIVWPDYDVPGYEFMGRLLFHLPQAQVIQPMPGVKGADAYDYFEAGGTLEGLGNLSGSPIVTGTSTLMTAPINYAIGARRPFAQ